MSEFCNRLLLEKMIVQRINAAATWGGTITKLIFSDEMVEEARREASAEVLRAVANSGKGYFGELSGYVAVVHNAFLPGHDGEPGIPQIVPFFGATARAGLPADPDEIDSYRTSPESYTGTSSGVAHAHNVAIGGKRSPLSCRYSMINGVFKFTGYSAEVPLLVITTAMGDTKIPISLGPAVVKLGIPKLVKPGTALSQFARADAGDGRDDLVSIQEGAMSVKPPRAIADIMQAQRQSI